MEEVRLLDLILILVVVDMSEQEEGHFVRK